MNLWDVVLLNKNKTFELDIPDGHNSLVFVRRGAVEVQGKALGLADVAIMNRDGEKLTVKATEKNTSLLIMSGEPIDEPIAARGPFVMNTQKQLNEAMQDFQRGLNGFER